MYNPFFLHYLFNTVLFLICFLQFFFHQKFQQIVYSTVFLTSLITIFLTLLITSTSSGHFGTQSFAKIFLNFDIPTWLSTLNLVFLSLFFYQNQSIYMLEFTSAGFILIVLWYVLLYLLTMSSNLSIHTFFNIEFIHL